MHTTRFAVLSFAFVLIACATTEKSDSTDAAKKVGDDSKDLVFNDDVKWWSYEEGIKHAEASSKPVALVVYAPWCPGCQELDAAMQAKTFVKDLVMIKVNRDERPELAAGLFPKDTSIPKVFFLSSKGEINYGLSGPHAEYPFFYQGDDISTLTRAMDVAVAANSQTPLSRMLAAYRGNETEAFKQPWFRPIFELTDGTRFSAGTAFVAKVEGKGEVMLTAHHLFGEAGGLEKEMLWNELGAKIKTVEAQEGKILFQKTLTLEGAAPISERLMNRDLAAFAIDGAHNNKVHEFRLELPKEGERVWLVAEAKIDGVWVNSYFAATVLRAKKDSIMYVFDEKIDGTATSGAPVVDEQGRVVAMNLSGGEIDGAVIGIGNPAIEMREMLLKAMK